MALDLGTLVARLRVDNDMDPGLARGRRSLDQFSARAGRTLTDLRGRFRALGRDAGEGLGDGVDQGSRRGLGDFSTRIRGLGDQIGDLAKKGVKGLGDLAGAAVKLAKENPQVAIGGLVGALGALPLVAGIASSALTAGLGGAIAMVGIKAAATSKQVKKAFGDLQEDLKGGLEKAAAPFEGALVEMIATARKELGGLAGPVKAAFANLAGPIEKAFGSVARAVGSLGPTLAYISQQAGPVVEVLGRELGILVKGLASDFGRLAEAADPRFITIMMGAFRGLSAILTEVIVRASQLGSAILDFAGFLGVDWKKPTQGANDFGSALDGTATASDRAATSIGEVIAKARESANAYLALQGGINGYEAALDGMTDAIKANGRTLDEHTPKGRANRDALYGIAAAALKLRDDMTASQEAPRKIADKMEEARKAFVDYADSMKGVSRKQAEFMADMAGLPSRKKIALELDGAKAAKDGIDSVTSSAQKVPDAKRIKMLTGGVPAAILDAKKIRQAVNDIPNSKRIYVSVVGGGPGGGTASALQRFKNMATGGLVKGPGTGISDSIPTNLSNGEYVLPAAVVQRVGVKKLDALRKGKDELTRGSSADPEFLPGARDTYTRGAMDEFSRGSTSSAALDFPELRKAIESQLKTLKAGLKKIREAREDLLEDLTSASADSVKSAAKSLSQMVRESFAGFAATTKVDDRLLAQISSTSKRLQGLANERAKIAERLQEALAFAASVTGRAAGDSSVLGIEVVDEEGQRVDPTGAELATGLKARLETLRKFSGDIRGLAAQGLSQTILRDLMEAGPAAAGGVAAAIGQGGQGVIAELTQLQNEIDTEAKNLGEFSANHLYDAGEKAGQGFLTGLQGQLDALEATMETLANNLITTVTNAIAAAQKIAAEQAEKLKTKEQEAKGKNDDFTRGSTADPKFLPGSTKAPKDDFARGSGAPKAALTIQNYHEAPGGNSRKTAEDLLLLTRSRG